MSGAAVDEALAAGGDADDVLRALVAALVRSPDIAWAGILFMEEGAPVLGPEAGAADPARRQLVPVTYQDALVGQLAVDGNPEPGLLERIAGQIPAYVLLGWDTGGEAWEP